MSKTSDIANIISALRAAFPNYNPDPVATTSMFLQILGDIDHANLQAAVLSLCADGRQFAPSAGEIRQAAIKLNALAAGIPDAWQAYEEVCKMPRQMCKWVETTERDWKGDIIFNIIDLHWSHEIVGKVASVMGWPESFPSDMPAADRAQFLKAYESEVSRMMGDAGRLQIVQDYIDKRAEMGGDALKLTASLTKQLEENRGY